MEDRILLAEGDVEKVDLILRRMQLEGRTDWVNLGDIEGFIDEVSSLRGRSQEEVGRAVALVVGKALSGGMFYLVRMDPDSPGGRMRVVDVMDSLNRRIAEIYREGSNGRWFEVLLELEVGK